MNFQRRIDDIKRKAELSNRLYYKPFLMVLFTLFATLGVMFYKLGGPIEVNLPDKVNVKSDTKIKLDENQFEKLVEMVQKPKVTYEFEPLKNEFVGPKLTEQKPVKEKHKPTHKVKPKHKPKHKANKIWNAPAPMADPGDKFIPEIDRDCPDGWIKSGEENGKVVCYRHFKHPGDNKDKNELMFWEKK